MFRFSQDGRVALIARLSALIACPPLLAAAYAAICSNAWYGILLAYAPIAGGWIGLASRPVLDAAADREVPRYEFSGKGGIIGSCAAFLPALVFAPAHADRRALVALFVASSLLYYAVGKIGCLFLGCCRAHASRGSRIALPAVESATSIALSAAVFATLLGSVALRLWTFPVTLAAFLTLRIFSRWARGSTVRDAVAQLDSIALAVLTCWAALSIAI